MLYLLQENCAVLNHNGMPGRDRAWLVYGILDTAHRSSAVRRTGPDLLGLQGRTEQLAQDELHRGHDIGEPAADGDRLKRRYIRVKRVLRP